METKRIQLYIGVGLLIVTVLVFFYSFISNLPSSDQVAANAHPLPTIPRDLFSSDNAITKQITGLNVPGNVPVVVDPSTVGRGNVFQNF